MPVAADRRHHRGQHHHHPAVRHAAPGTPFGVYQSVRQARTLLKGKPVPAGTWWQLPVNPAAPKAAQKLCYTLPLFDFTTPGEVPPTPPVPLQTLADYAYNHMAIPAPTLTVNPAGHGYVNLATYVWGRTVPVSATTGRPGAYEVTAMLGGETVSVWARLAPKGAFSVAADGPGTPYSACGPDGSRDRVGHVPASSGGGHPARLRRALAGPGGRGVRQRHRHLGGHLGGGRAQRARPARAAAHPDDRPHPAVPGGGDPEHQRVNPADAATIAAAAAAGLLAGRAASRLTARLLAALQAGGSRSREPRAREPHDQRVLSQAGRSLTLGTGLAFAVMAARLGRAWCCPRSATWPGSACRWP